MSDLTDARDEFVTEGRKVLKHMLSVAVGSGELLDSSKMSSKEHPVIVREMIEMIKRLDDREKITIESTAKIIDTLADGKITIAQAKNLMSILHTKTAIDAEMASASEEKKALKAMIMEAKS